jgi:hypothetical protein
MEINLNREGLDSAFSYAYAGSDGYTPPISDDSEANPQEERVRIANFAEEIKDKANYSGMDICFVIDSTGSMGSYIEGAKESLRTIINDAKKSLSKLNAGEDSLKFAIVAYRDHPPQDNTYVTSICDFCSSTEAESFLTKITAGGGGDHPEAVMDGLHDALYKTTWREKTEKFLFLVLDAPPHGKRFTDGGDGFPDGCPCGYSEVTILPDLRDKKIDFTIIKLNNSIKKMVDIFSQYTNIDVFQPNAKKGSVVKDCVNSKVVENLNTYCI